jgi:sulfur carrier protein ThiS adenylyltransferase
MKSFTEIKRILKKKSVGIAGAGGLGSNCAVALARVGVGRLVIADFDVITKQNLNRQYYFLEQIGQKKVFALADNIFYINPYINVEPHDKKLKPHHIKPLFGKCDVIIEAFDLAEMKEMLIETVLEELPDKPLIVGLGMAGWGDNNSIKTRESGNLYICGDERSEINELLPPLAPRVGIVAHMQANLALELLLNQ